MVKRWPATYHDWAPLSLLIACWFAFYVLTMVGWLVAFTDGGAAFLSDLETSVDRFVDTYPWLPYLGLGIWIWLARVAYSYGATPKEGYVEIDGDQIRIAYGRHRAELYRSATTVRTSRWLPGGTKILSHDTGGSVLELAQGSYKPLLIGGADARPDDPGLYNARDRKKCHLYLSEQDFWELFGLLHHSADCPAGA